MVAVFIKTLKSGWRGLKPGVPGSKSTTPVLDAPTPTGTTPTASGLLSIDQGSPQTSTAAWQGINATVGRAAAGATVGSWAWTFSPTSSAVQLQAFLEPPLSLVTSASEITVTAKGVTQQGTGRQFELGVDWFDAAGAFLSRSVSTTVPTLSKTAQDITYKVSIPVGAAKWRPLFQQGMNMPAQGDVVTVGEFRAEVTATSSSSGVGSGGTGTTTPPVVTPPSTGGGTVRKAFYDPFSPDSPWKLPVVNGVATTDNASMRSVTAYANCTNYSHGVVQAVASDPWVKCVDTVHGNWTVQAQIPSWAQPSSGSDAHLEVVQVDGTLVEMFGASRIGTTQVNAQRIAVTKLTGTGLGPQSGVRAYGGSAIGGLVRMHECDPNHPQFNAAYPIPHALALALDVNQLQKNVSAWQSDSNSQWGYYSNGSVTNPTAQPGHNPGKNRNGYGSELGYVWPATEQDYNSMSSGWYGGSIPMGSHWVIPSSVSLSSLGLSTQIGQWMAQAAQDYGAYISDATWGCTAFYFEYVSNTLNANSACSSFVSSGDCKKVRDALRRVNVSTEANPGGGPLSATNRRRPIAGPVSV